MENKQESGFKSVMAQIFAFKYYHTAVYAGVFICFFFGFFTFTCNDMVLKEYSGFGFILDIENPKDYGKTNDMSFARICLILASLLALAGFSFSLTSLKGKNLLFTVFSTIGLFALLMAFVWIKYKIFDANHQMHSDLKDEKMTKDVKVGVKFGAGFLWALFFYTAGLVGALFNLRKKKVVLEEVNGED